MDFDLSKENIQPLRGGRNVHQLEMALQAQTNQEYQMQLLQQKEEFETLIRNYAGEDPLENYYNYIMWIEQSYPKNGHEGNCASLLEHCLMQFENDKRYTNDRRFCKLWIKYIDMFPNPLELYLMMKSKNLCTGCADFYKAWAYYYEAAGDFRNADRVFEEGKKNLAQPYEELDDAHKNLITAAGEHTLYGRNENRLQEKRQALTSLQSYNSGRVASVRVASGVTNGIATGPSNHRPNAPLNIYEEQSAASLAGGAAPRSIITVAKRQEAPKENTLKPGPWTTVPHKKRVLASHKSSGLGFTVHEDDSDEALPGCLPANLPPECLEDYRNWHVSLVNFPDEPSPTVVHGYPKNKVYSDPQTEYSIEEIRAIRYKRNVAAIQEVKTNEVVQSILVEDDDDDCIVVSQELPQPEPVGQLKFQIFEDFQAAERPSSSPSAAGNSGQMSFNQGNSLTVRHSPWKSQAEHQNFLQDVFGQTNEHRIGGSSNTAKFGMSQEDEPERRPRFRLSFSPQETAQRKTGGFAIYEQSMQEIQSQAPPKGNAMKTAFRTPNVDEVETGSRGGMDDVATAVQPADGAKPMACIPFSDSSSSSFDDAENAGLAPLEVSCTTQQFNFNLNAMKVSTPQNKGQGSNEIASEHDLENSRKRLFSENMVQDKAKLSTILEEKSVFGSSSSSSGATTKSSLYSQHHRLNMISEEHNSYLAQNMKANEVLRRSLLGNLMDDPEDILPTHMVTAPSSPMQSSPAQSPVRRIPPPNVGSPLDYVPSDPFSAVLIAKLLEKVSFPGVHNDGYVSVAVIPRIVVKKEPLYIGRDCYNIEKLLGKGQFGTIYKVYSHQMSCTVALKFEKPPNKWEYYICRELQARLANHPLRDRFMDVSVGYFSDQASILVSQYEPFGSLLDTANLIKKHFSKGKETICIHFTLEMLKIVEAMHQVKIIHADIKPDNFLVMLQPDDTLSLQLIDFGCSIDMSLFPENATFRKRITTEDFVCCEVRDGRPWSYHTDLFCVAASAHVLLFHDYIQLRKCNDVWSIAMRYPRYVRANLWNMFFSSLLNQQSGPADVATLVRRFQEELEEPQRKKDLTPQFRTITNLLKNR